MWLKPRWDITVHLQKQTNKKDKPRQTDLSSISSKISIMLFSCTEQEPECPCSPWECITVQTFCKTFNQFLKKLNTLAIWSSNLTLGYLPKQNEKYVKQKVCKWMFIADLFMFVPNRKSPKCPLINDQINKLWFSLTMEYYSA